MGIPVIVDLRSDLPLARDQGARDTCVAFSVTCAHEAARHELEMLSEDALHWGCKTIDGDWKGGTSFETVASALSQPGQPEASTWPYDLALAKGEPIVPPPGVSPNDGWRRARLEATEPTESSVCAALAAGRVVVLGVELTPQWYLVDGSGMMSPLAGGEDLFGLHAIAATGYDQGSGVLWIRNSWGPGWARDGYAALPFPYFRHIVEAWLVPPGGLDP